MYFKGMELAGFKSFADKVEIKFDDGITAIVGPNGCGKSNVGDAIRWVLGEQSSKSLRGNSMQDVIFSGTEKRKSLSYCEVSLFFNNTDRLFNFEYDDIIVTRKLYRSGESEYLINRNPCRLKDITNLFFDSGIGRDGYSIISQGKVEEIISSKPEQRRLIFEEAAGIAKFKSQKVESERKLERTEENLTRLRDIVGELDRQLGPLKKQAEVAKVYLELRDQLKSLEVNAFIYQTENVDAQKAVLQERMNGILEEISLKEAQMVALSQKSADCHEQVEKIDEAMKSLNNEILRLTVGMEKQAGETKLLQERINNLLAQNKQIEDECLNAKNAILKNKAELDFKTQRKAELEARAKAATEASGDAAGVLETFNNLKAQESTLSAQIKTLQQETTELYSAVMVEENRRKLLMEYQQEFEGFAYAVKRILKDAETNAHLKSKFVGVLANLVQVQDKFETAIEVALGASLQNIVTQNEENAKELITYLKNHRYGRATFMPITTMKPRSIPAQDEKYLGGVGVYGVASGLLKFAPEISNVVQNLLGNVVIVENLDIATSLARQCGFRFKIVTLEGDVINPSGAMTGGSKKSNATNLISRDREVEALAQSIKTNKLAFNEKKILLKDCEAKFAEVQKNLSAIDQEKNSTALKEAVQIAEIRTEIAGIENDFARINGALAEMQRDIAAKLALHKQNQEIIATQKAQVNQILASSENKDLQVALEKIRAQQDANDLNKLKLNEVIRQIEAEKEAAMGAINVASDKKYKVQADLEKITADLDNMAQRILDEYNLTYDTCLEFKKEDFEFEGCMTQVYRLKKEISKLGHVNVNAIEDSKAVYSRWEELSGQLNDLEQSKADTLQAINDLAAEMSKRFEDKFTQIQKNFEITFRELFGGGNAHLELVGSDNILEAGVDIVAEPPGKKLQNINLLSGGEKALTAIAILFAILKLRPMPFCLLDEIEAALDEANVERFARYLHRFSDTTQFIVVTHRKPTMELADSLYGVTMQEKGVSRIVSVKLSEAYQAADTQEAQSGAV